MNTPVCLTMIVKDEAAIITRGLDSILPYITHYAICDTGSTDSTVEVVEEYMKRHSIEGKVFKHPWKNFGHNRTLALEASRQICPTGWSWMLDADDTIDGNLPKDFLSNFPDPTVNGFSLTIKQGGSTYRRTQLFRNDTKWRYERSLHEFPTCDAPKIADMPSVIWNNSCREGARNKDPLKYRKDAEVLMDDLAKYPNDPRTLFYIANSWRDAGNREKAIKYYHRRAALKTGWNQEAYISYLNLLRLETNWNTKLELAWKALEIDPTRLEVPFHIMVEACMRHKDIQQAYAMAASVENRDMQPSMLFIENETYEWRFDAQLAALAALSCHKECAKRSVDIALTKAPDSEKPRLEQLKAEILR
jgi:glycosyltransferase involved in cell wall biosynthesis